jgi:hypothetical protein
MQRELRKLWILPWVDDRNAIACAAQVLLALSKKNAHADKQQLADVLHAAQVIDTWHQKAPGDHDKAMIKALDDANVMKVGYDMSLTLRAAVLITKRALTNDLTSNATTIRALMDTIVYANGAAEVVGDAMAKWRFFDATGRTKMDEELRGAFEAYWLAGEYAAGYAFVGAAWPAEWVMELAADPAGAFGSFGTGVTISTTKFYTAGLFRRDVQ